MSDGEFIHNIASIEKILDGLSLREFTTISSVLFFATNDKYRKYNLHLKMSSGQDHFGDELCLQFGGVSNLRIISFGGGLTQIVGLYIKDISGNGWNEINWEIGDFENGAISFLADTLSMRLMRNEPLQ